MVATESVFRVAAFYIAIFTVSLAEETEEAPACDLLQTGVHFSKTRVVNGGDWNQSEMIAAGICVPALPEQAILEPILKISALYDKDGWCVLGYIGFWVSGCAVARRNRDVTKFATMYQREYASYLNGDQATPFALQLPNHRTLVIRDHNYPLDDLYCYVNGWYSLPRHEVVNNFTYLEEVSNRWCDHLAEIVPGYYNISIADLANESEHDEAFLENLMKNGTDTGYVPQSVVDGMYLHAASKCVMRGHNRGAVCDIATCAQRGCFSTSASSIHQLHYTVRGECESVTP